MGRCLGFKTVGLDKLSGRYVVAVSGGVDSVVLLHQLSLMRDLELVVAHFDHGIRDDSSQDAKFVAGLAKFYDLPFEVKREKLGKNSSENLARNRRYKFLRSIAEKYDALIITAHHSDDAIETIAINITRGTGWRGLAVLDSDIIRPLLGTTKQDILIYAQRHHLKWREDGTNASDVYLRNRIRRKTTDLTDDNRLKLLKLRQSQIRQKNDIDNEVSRLIGAGPAYTRYFFGQLDEKTAIECLRYITQARLTRPQLRAAILAIKTSLPGKTFQAGNGVVLSFTSRNFSMKLIK